VKVADRTVELGTDEAESAAAVSASAVRQGAGPDTAADAVAEVTDLPGPDARAVADALTGRTRHGLTCTHGGGGEEESDALGRTGLTARAERVGDDLDEAFGGPPVGGFAPGGVRTGHMPGSAHYEGRAVDVFVRPISAANTTKGWAMAQYLAARAKKLNIRTIIFSDKIWTAGGQSDSGWRDYTPPERAGDQKILRHLDHVHVDVLDN
jgi:hypothetical protein